MSTRENFYHKLGYLKGFSTMGGKWINGKFYMQLPAILSGLMQSSAKDS